MFGEGNILRFAFSLCLPVALFAAVAAFAVPNPTHAATALFHNEIFWQSNRSVVVTEARSGLPLHLTPGHQISIRHGSLVLTVALRTARSSPPAPPSTRAGQAPESPVITLLKAINAARADHGLSAVTLDSRQSGCSLRHSRHMAARGFISHDQFPADICMSHTDAGENVGEVDGYPPEGTLLLNQEMLAEGPCPDTGCPNGEEEVHGHYMNIVNPIYTRVGIGIFVQDGITWLTEDFAN